MPHLPALITSGDVMPGGGDLNGRRWAGHQLLRAWARFVGDSPLALAHADPQQLRDLKPWLRVWFQANSNQWVWCPTLSRLRGIVSAGSIDWPLGPVASARRC